MTTPLRLNLRAQYVVARGAGAATSPFVKTGSVTVIAAVGTQARVCAGVRVCATEHVPADGAPSSKSVDFDKVQQSDVLSLTAGALGAVSVPLSDLELDAPRTAEYALVSTSSATAGGDVSFSIRLTLTRTHAPARATAGAQGVAGLGAVGTPSRIAGSGIGGTPSALTTAAAVRPGGIGVGSAMPAARTEAISHANARAQAPVEPKEAVIETFVLTAPAPAPVPAPAPAPAPIAAPAPAPPAPVEIAPAPVAAVDAAPAGTEVQSARSRSQTAGSTATDAGTAAATITAPGGEHPKPETAEKDNAHAHDNAPSAPAIAPTPASAPAPAADAALSRIAPTTASPPATGGSTPLPTRLIDYFAVMVPTEVPLSHEDDSAHSGIDDTEPDHELDSDAEETAAPDADRPLARHRRTFRRRLGHIQFRYPKNNHEDVPLPDNMDWFIFPNGIAPIVQPTASASRPPTRRSVFVLSNVGGSALATTMYGCCLTAYRLEEESRDNENEFYETTPGNEHKGETKWWPVVLFILSRLPIVPQLQVILEKIYDTYDRGCSTGAADENSLPKAYCSLAEYLRMLVYEAPVPIRRMNLAVQLFMPGEAPRLEPQEDSTCTVFLPSPDCLPEMQFDARHVLRRFEPNAILQLVAAMVLEQRLVVIARSVEQIVETVEVAMALLYPLSWDLPYIPVLPAHLAADLLSSPVPFCYGLLTTYAARVLTCVSPEDARELVVVDVTTGHVDRGAQAYLERRAARVGLPADHAELAAASETPAFPDPLRTDMLAELATITNAVRSDDDGLSRTACNTALQSLFARFFAVLLYGYRTATFFPGSPPQFHAQLCTDAYVETKSSALTAATALARAHALKSRSASGASASVPDNPDTARAFLRMLCDTQSMQRLLQRHTSVHLRPFHALTSMLSTSPSIAETRKWVAPVATPAFTLVVPPPGYPQLFPWQINSVVALMAGATAFGAGNVKHTAGVYDRQLPPAPTLQLQLPAPLKPKRGTKKERKEEWELARRFASGEVAASVGMNAWETQELELLVVASAKGNNGSRGDDVGGPAEASDAASLTETAMLFSAAAEAAGTESNPVVGRRSAAPAGEDVRRAIARQRAKEAAAARAAVKSVKRGWFRGGGLAEAPAASVEQDDAQQEGRVHAWLQACLVSGVFPSGLMNAQGVLWSPDDDALANAFTSPVVRATFVKVLQAQLLLSAGLAAPQSGAVAGDSIQLQPLLGLGVSEHALTSSDATATAGSSGSHLHSGAAAFKGPTGHRAARTLLVQSLPLQRFLRLAAMCSVVLSRCASDKDFSVAAALLQLSFFFYTEPSRDTTATGRAGKGAWSAGRQYLNQELAAEPVWRQLPFWDAYVALALAVEEQQAKLLHLNAQLHGVQSSKESSVAGGALAVAHAVTQSGMTYIYTLLQSLLGPMLQMGVFPHEVRAWVSRCSGKYRINGDEERTIVSLIDHLAAAEASSVAGGQAGPLSTLALYSSFVRGNALATATPATAPPPPGAQVSERSGTPSTARSEGSLTTPPRPASAAASGRAAGSAQEPAAEQTAVAPGTTGAADVAPAPVPAPAASSAAAEAHTTGTVASQPGAATAQAVAVAAPTPATASQPPPASAVAPAPAVAPVAPPAVDTAAPASSSATDAAAATAVSSAPAAPSPSHAPADAGDQAAKHLQHPWAHLSAREAEAGALALVSERRFPPVPDASVLSRPKALRGKPPASAVSKSSVSASTHVPAGGVDAAGAAAHAAATGGAEPARAVAAPPPVPAATARSKMPFVKAFGSSGLSVIASTFSAALPGVSPSEASRDAATAAAPSSDESLLDTTLRTIARAAIRASLGPGAISTGNERLPPSVSMSCLAFRGHAAGAAITCMSHDSEDHRVVTGGNDGRVVLWDMMNRTFVHSYEEHTAAITAVKLCGDVVVSASQDATIRISSFTRQAYGAPPAQKSPTGSASAQPAAPAQAATFTGSAGPAEDFDDDDDDDGEGSVEESAAASARPASASTTPMAAAASSAAYLAGGEATNGAAATSPAKAGGMASLTNALHNISIPFPFPIPTMLGAGARGSHKFMSALRLKGHSGPVTAIDAWERPEERKTGWFSRKTAEAPTARTLPSTSNYIIVSGGSDGTIRTWAARWTVNKRGRAKGTALHLSTITNLHKPGTIIEQVKLSSDGRLCVSAGRDGRIGVVDVATGKTWVMMMPSASRGLFSWGAGPSSPIDPVAAPTGLPLVSCSIDVSRRPVTVTSAGADGTVRVWDLRTGAVSVAFPSGQPVWCTTTVPAHGGGAPAFDAEGNPMAPAAPLGDNYLLSGHEDGVLRKWDSRKAGVPLAAWAGHSAAITSLSSLGDKVVTGCVDGAVRIWDASTGVSLRCDGHAQSVVATSVSEDYFLTASWDGTLRCWFPVS